MSQRVEVTLLLCDHVAAAEGKLYINGAGWTLTGPKPAPSAIALLMAIPWDLANTPIRFTLRLLQADGQPVTQHGPAGETAVEVGGQVEVGRPPGTTPGTSLPAPLAINIPPLVLPPGERFSWELTVNGESREGWHLAFSTREQPAVATGPTNT